jgi:hypothetical protein
METKLSKMEVRRTICIPRVEKKMRMDYIKQKFAQWNIGKVVQIKEIPLHTDTDYKRVMIDIYMNASQENSMYVLNRFDKGQTVKLVHNNPWFWKMMVAR